MNPTKCGLMDGYKFLDTYAFKSKTSKLKGHISLMFYTIAYSTFKKFEKKMENILKLF